MAKQSEKAALNYAVGCEGWRTALFCFAERIRALSHGCINHKVLYSYVGLKGHYINHANPSIRKRTATMLSRLIHSLRYVDDFKESCVKNSQVFAEGAQSLCRDLEKAGIDPGNAIREISYPTWKDVSCGFANEWRAGRTDLNLARINNEMQLLFSVCAIGQGDAEERLNMLVSSYFHLLTFGHLDEELARRLAEATPDEIPDAAKASMPSEDRACLVKYDANAPGVVADWWLVDSMQPFFIGRYTDSDVIEGDPSASRQHCRIVRDERCWRLEDLGSKHGTRVVRGKDNRVAYDSLAEGSGCSCDLQAGDRIVLAGSSWYWFGIMDDRGER
ncbi:FHA domain-containing protein [Arabiibacter massiliensis]|uniref:FHA domain-containing protein n=1 Tax=Arabiibacter massiliensis TaxID=1870985 RepID=UPI00155A77F0|nr:FHA domain-containing protein [Arabiibacter massiliensis]